MQCSSKPAQGTGKLGKCPCQIGQWRTGYADSAICEFEDEDVRTLFLVARLGIMSESTLGMQIPPMFRDLASLGNGRGSPAVHLRCGAALWTCSDSGNRYSDLELEME